MLRVLSSRLSIALAGLLTFAGCADESSIVALNQRVQELEARQEGEYKKQLKEENADIPLEIYTIEKNSLIPFLSRAVRARARMEGKDYTALSEQGQTLITSKVFKEIDVNRDAHLSGQEIRSYAQR